MSEEKELKAGDAIKLTDDQFESLELFIKETHKRDVLLMEVATLIKKDHENFWQSVREMHPEIEGHVCQYDYNAKKIRVLRKKTINNLAGTG